MLVQTIETVLTAWLGEQDEQGMSPPEQTARWYKKDPSFDAWLRETFASTWDAIMTGQCEHWLDEPRGRLAYVLVLDQLSRNMFRGEAKMFAGDPRGLRAAQSCVARGADRELLGHGRVFLYLPFMHSEDLAMQDECVRLFSAFRDESSGALRAALESNVQYAHRHRDIIVQWGRFPHRNEILGRTSTPEEAEFLKQPGSSF